jgi:biopolymer transport protein ExbD
MRHLRTRTGDATFDLNLAPILDIIVSIVPLLLLSVAFVQVKMIDTSVPQVVAEAAQRANEKSETTVTLKVSKTKGFTFEVMKDGKKTPTDVPNANGGWNLTGLVNAAFVIKQKNPEVFRVDLAPEGDVDLNALVSVMDKLRRSRSRIHGTRNETIHGSPKPQQLQDPNHLDGGHVRDPARLPFENIFDQPCEHYS